MTEWQPIETAPRNNESENTTPSRVRVTQEARDRAAAILQNALACAEVYDDRIQQQIHEIARRLESRKI